jgi:glycosyltransferase involved in cell wall biosynthesis
VSKLLYFTRDYTAHDHRFLTALAHTNHKVYYLRLERRGYQMEDRPLPPQIKQVHWYGGHAPMGLKHGPRLLWDLKRVIREIKPDLIQAGPLQRSAFLVALAGFRPLLSMSWGYDLIIDAQRNALWRWATRYTLQCSATMLGDSKVIRELAVSFGMPHERIVTFPWGTDLEHFSPPADPRTQNGAFTLLSTRSWEPIYGVDLIANAFVQTARQRPELRLVMLGNGSQATLLRQIFLRAGLVDRVSLPGQVRHADLPRYYRSADLYLSASHSDGTSISLLEAMACGCPALVSDIPGNREWVNPGENGWRFPDGDAEALAEAILNAVAERQNLETMGRNARQVAEQRADWHKNIQILMNAFESLGTTQ